MAFQAPRRAYAGSMVPLRTGGYRPNRVERKVNDIGVSTFAANLTGSITLLANPTLGSDFNNRIGRKVNLKSVYVRGYLFSDQGNTMTTSTPTTCQQCRMIIFADMQPNGAAPAFTDLLVSAHPASHLNMNNRDRFKVYCDKEFALDPIVYTTTATAAVATASRQIYNVKKYKKLNLEMIFNATNGGTIADITSGALYMAWIGSNAASAQSDATAQLSTRVRYVDA